MSTVKISQLPLATGATGPNTFIPVIIDGENYKVAADDYISSGATGPVGSTGATGATGLKGSTGPIGATGSGSTGATGFKGATGATGLQGATGSGATGAPGLGLLAKSGEHIGTSGWVGSYYTVTFAQPFSTNDYTPYAVVNLDTTNPVNAWSDVIIDQVTTTGFRIETNGVIGANTSVLWNAVSHGETGVPTTGATGLTGATGSQGPIGNVGATGLKGSTGFTGATGSGATGATGSQGAQGLTGATGSGATGATGPQGNLGSTGATGSQGLTGSTGPNGTNGATGATGPQGLTGATGPAPTAFTVNTVAQAATVTIDMATASGTWQQITLSSATNLTFAFSNRAAGRYTKVRVVNTSGGNRSITLPGALQIGTPAPPTVITNGSAAIYTFQFWGTTDALGEATGYTTA